jgi:hypothetical protein
MKKIVIALAALTVFGTASAYSYTCRQNCYWVGDQQYCTTTCSEW